MVHGHKNICRCKTRSYGLFPEKPVMVESRSIVTEVDSTAISQ
jgi:hypothetical protein